MVAPNPLPTHTHIHTHTHTHTQTRTQTHTQTHTYTPHQITNPFRHLISRSLGKRDTKPPIITTENMMATELL